MFPPLSLRSVSKWAIARSACNGARSAAAWTRRRWKSDGLGDPTTTGLPESLVPVEGDHSGALWKLHLPCLPWEFWQSQILPAFTKRRLPESCSPEAQPGSRSCGGRKALSLGPGLDTEGREGWWAKAHAAFFISAHPEAVGKPSSEQPTVLANKQGIPLVTLIC